MSHPKPRHAKPARFRVSPSMALAGILVLLDARSEAQAATDAQNAASAKP